MGLVVFVLLRPKSKKRGNLFLGHGGTLQIRIDSVKVWFTVIADNLMDNIAHVVIDDSLSLSRIIERILRGHGSPVVADAVRVESEELRKSNL